MGFLFSKEKKHKGEKKKPNGEVTPHDQAILDLKNAQNNLKRLKKKARDEKQTFFFSFWNNVFQYETTIEREVQIARELKKKGDKKGALLALKKKKLQETNLQKAEDQIMNLENMIQTIDWKTQELQVFEAMKQGKNTLEDLNSMMTLEDVEQLMEENEEALEHARVHLMDQKFFYFFGFLTEKKRNWTSSLLESSTRKKTRRLRTSCSSSLRKRLSRTLKIFQTLLHMKSLMQRRKLSQTQKKRPPC